MKPFEIFKAGRHTSASGTALSFSDADLRAAVAAYDPALHEAAITVGHPKDNLPAYGWIKAISFADGAIVAEPQQVEEQFAEMVQAGRFKKRSASFYTPDAANNPKPGAYYLRHVAFLGAQPPAVKGLKDVSFADGDESVTVEFGETESRYAWGSVGSLFRSLREWLIADKGMEVADRLIPSYALSDIEGAARAPSPTPAAVMPNFSEETTMKTAEQLQAELTAMQAERDALKTQAAQAANFAELDTSLKAREAAVAARELVASRAATEARIDAGIKAGRLLPAAKASTLNFAMSLSDAGESIDFGEGAAAKKVTQREAYLLSLDASPKIVEFRELSGETKTGKAEGASVDDLSKKTRAIVDAAAAKGESVSYTEAFAQATAEIESGK